MSCLNFFNLEFEVNDSVLKPYRLTETIVENAIEMLKDKQNPTFLDIGCGSGNIAVSILKNVPQAIGVAVDISPDAVALASINARKHDVDLTVYQSDVFETVRGEFDLIVCNSPYLTGTNSAANRPGTTDGKDGLTVIRQVAKDAAKYLKQGGTVLLEYQGGFFAEITAMFDGWTVEKILGANGRPIGVLAR